MRQEPVTLTDWDGVPKGSAICHHGPHPSSASLWGGVMRLDAPWPDEWPARPPLKERMYRMRFVDGREAQFHIQGVEFAPNAGPVVALRFVSISPPKFPGK
jgi:hypothetical protein